MANGHALCSLPEEILVIFFKEHFAKEVLRIAKREPVLPKTQKVNCLDIIRREAAPTEGLPSCMNVLIVCKAFHRIGLPQFYATVTFVYTATSFKKALSLKKLDVYRIRPLDRIRNIYWKKLPIERLIILSPWFNCRYQLAIIKHEISLCLKSDGHLKFMQKLVDRCRAFNIRLETRLHTSDTPYPNNGPSRRLCHPYLRLIVDTNGAVELIAAHMIDQDFFNLAKSKIDAMFGCGLPNLDFKPGKRRTLRATDLARSHWEKFGKKV